MVFTAVIADDDSIICEGLKAIITSAFPEINIAGIFYNGKDMMNYIESHHTDIIITDIQMPGYSGLDAARYVHDHSRYTKVILITGHKLFEYAKSAIDNNVCSFITKPYDPEDLIRAVSEIITELKSNIAESHLNTNVYFNNWYHLKTSLIKMYDSGLADKNLKNEVFCAYTKSADQLKAKLIHVHLIGNSDADEIGDFDSPLLSSFVIHKKSSSFTSVILYENENHAKNFIEDMKKHAEILGSRITINSIHDYDNIFDMIQKSLDEQEDSNDIVKLAIEYINENYGDPNISMEKISQKLHISKNYLGTLIRKRTGVSYNNYLMNIRIEKAKELLLYSNISVKEICNLIGLLNIDYFRSNFKRITGTTPSSYRKRYIKKDI